MPKPFAELGKFFTYGELSRPKLEFSVMGRERQDARKTDSRGLDDSFD
jgi:hypothetical protein